MGDVKGERLRLLGIEPRAPDLESDMLPLHHSLCMPTVAACGLKDKLGPPFLIYLTLT